MVNKDNKPLEEITIAEDLPRSSEYSPWSAAIGCLIGAGAVMLNNHLEAPFRKITSEPYYLYQMNANDDVQPDYLIINGNNERFLFLGLDDGSLVRSGVYWSNRSEAIRSELEKRTEDFFITTSHFKAKNSNSSAKEVGK